MTVAERSPWRSWSRGLKRLRRALWRLLGWLIIGSAVLVGLGRLLAPYADHARPVLERVLTERIGQPVRLEALVASWPRLSPVLELQGLSIGDGSDPLLQIERSRLEIQLYKLIDPARNALELVAIGVDLGLVQDEAGRWDWQLNQGGRVGGDWQRTLGAGDLVLRDSRIRIIPHDLPRLELDVPEARLHRSGAELRIRMTGQAVDTPIERIEVRLRLLQGAQGIESASAYAFAPRLQTPWGEATPAGSRLQVWLDWNLEQGARLHARSRLGALADAGKRALERDITIDGRWQNERYALEFNAAADSEQSPRPVERLVVACEDGRLGLVADHLDLEFLHAHAAPWLSTRTAFWPSRLEGEVDDLAVGWSELSGLFRLAGQVSDIGLTLPAAGITLDRLRLGLELAGDRPSIRVSGPLRAELPALYPEAVEFEQIEGRVELMQESIRLDAVGLQHQEFELQLDGDLLRVDDAPFIDLQIRTPRLSPADPRRWLPRSGLGPNTRRWLEQALLGLAEASADTVLFGRPSTWRQRIPSGALESRLDFRGLTLDYARNWPLAREMQGQVIFLGESLHARVDRGDLAGQVLRAPGIRIDQLRSTEIELELESIDSDAPGLVELTRSFPLEAARTALAQMEWSGPARASARLWLPVKHLHDWRLVGAVDIEGARLALPTPELDFASVSGQVPFTRDRFGPARLRVSIGGEPSEVTLDAWIAPDFDLRLAGEMSLGGLIPASWTRRVPGLAPAFVGTSPVTVRIGRGIEVGTEGLQLELSSNLEGIELELPEPLRKPAALAWPMRLLLPLDDSATPIRFDLEPLGSCLVFGDEHSLQVGLGLGATPARLPNAEDFLVEGRVESLDIVGWVSLFGGALGQGNARGAMPEPSGWLSLAVDDLLIGERSLGPADLALEREPSYWRLRARGERMEGALRLPAAAHADQDLVADFERLNWPAVSAEDPAEPAPPSAMDPVRMPALNLLIRSMFWGDLNLGEVRLASHRTESGMEIERFSTRASELEVTGSGRWNRSASADELPMTWVNLRVASGNLGQHLRQAGFDVALERGNAAVEFAGRWPGTPVDFALRRVSGTLGVRIDDGAIPAARPGAGRLLGLVSLNSIPRRLRLDFSDVFGDGLGFDRISGDFVLTDGLAQTDNLRIDAPAAEIRITGRTDLGQQSYDQIVSVRPGLSATLPVIGALAGGPVGAAAGAALQRIFSRPLQGMSEIRYSVTGSWDDPRIEPEIEPQSDAPPGRP